MAIFNSYVSLPEGISNHGMIWKVFHPQKMDGNFGRRASEATLDPAMIYWDRKTVFQNWDELFTSILRVYVSCVIFQ